jgi:DNA-binding XRE family transcriptional regulator
MPFASPELRRLRLRAGVKSGQWADRVRINRNHYVNVESGRKVGSPELFGRCALALTELLGETVETDDLISQKGGGRDVPRPRNATAGGETAEAEATAEATASEAETETSVRRSA